MDTQSFVDQLRKTLTDRGHILPTLHQRQDCMLLNQGEYLVSILSHDRTLIPFLSISSDGSDGVNSLAGRYRSVMASDFDCYVDLVKFVWLNEGVTAVLDLVKFVGFFQWTRMTSSLTRQHLADEAASIAEKTLRLSGTKFREMAEFFADPRSSMSMRIGKEDGSQSR
jgi:hypothetical protein